MTIQKVIGENGIQQMCRNGACPAVILTDSGDVFVQGYVPASEEDAALTKPPGEGFVRMPRTVFNNIARHVLVA